MVNILHISAHMGGGVGKFLSQTTSYEKRNNSIYTHKILLLEQPQKLQFIDVCNESGVIVEVVESYTQIEKEMLEADIVILHWWHNPTMCRLLANFPALKIRLIIWVHISGCNYPALTEEFAMIPNRLFFTSPYSYENPLWTKKAYEKILGKSKVIYGLGVENLAIKAVNENINSDKFTITYIGTLDESKIHPNFIKFCKEVIKRVPCARFVMLGDLSENNNLFEQAKIEGIESCFDFIGYTRDVDKYLQESDAFGYPLNPYHFGTTENSIMEAMAFGIPVVMLDQCTEKYIVQNGYDGLLAQNEEDYAKCIQLLYENPKERSRLGKNAQNTILEKFSMKSNVSRMHNQFELILKENPKIFQFASTIGEVPIQWFLEGLGKDRVLFENVLADKENKKLLDKVKECEPILRGKSKSSAIHFAEVYPEEKELQFLKNILANG
ncbi:glycosyltransferase [Aminipila terrae]|uniref:Glycosyltransferase n=1 Tax=Aminipila terrae TaxID=2697030 RepID=A0A6P1MD60_9FIRM|nr:glycosyltransferase [Aminipila terrae]QHI71952.1 glycosyltransferase [Aminipila terrae]